MKSIVTKVENKATLTAAATATALATPMIASAGGTATAATQAKDKVVGIVEIVVDIFPLIGLFFVVAGGFKLVMAYRNDQPEAQTSAAKDIVIGVVLVLFRVFAWPAIRNAF